MCYGRKKIVIHFVLLLGLQAEGAPVSYLSTVFVDVDQNNTFMETVNFTLPPSTVSGSERAKVKVSGEKYVINNFTFNERKEGLQNFSLRCSRLIAVFGIVLHSVV